MIDLAALFNVAAPAVTGIMQGQRLSRTRQEQYEQNRERELERKNQTALEMALRDIQLQTAKANLEKSKAPASNKYEYMGRLFDTPEEVAAAKGVIEPPKAEAPKAPVLGTPEYMQAQEDLEKMRNRYRPAPQPGPAQLVQTDGGFAWADPRQRTLTPDKSGVGPRQDAASMRASQEAQGMKREINAALTELERYPDAVGAKRMAPEPVNSRLDPKGVPVRAAIANVGSMLTLMRSGGAVSDGEFERIGPFIPKASDSAATVRMKLRYLADWIERKQGGGMMAPDVPQGGYSPDNPFAGGGR